MVETYLLSWSLSLFPVGLSSGLRHTYKLANGRPTWKNLFNPFFFFKSSMVPWNSPRYMHGRRGQSKTTKQGKRDTRCLIKSSLLQVLNSPFTHPSWNPGVQISIFSWLYFSFHFKSGQPIPNCLFLPKPPTSTPISVKDNCHPSRHASQNSGSPLTIQSPTPHIKSTGKSVYVYISRIHHWTQQEEQR